MRAPWRDTQARARDCRCELLGHDARHEDIVARRDHESRQLEVRQARPRIEGDQAVLGITWFAQDALGELVHYEPPNEGDTIARDSAYGEVESVKAVSDVIAPLSGEVIEVNKKVVDEPETVNADPYGEGWLVRIRLSDPAEADALLDVDAYKQVVAES